MRRTLKVALLAAAVAAAPTAVVFGRADDVKREIKKDAKDTWLEAMAKYHLIVADGVPGGSVHVDANNGVALTGKVETEAKKQKAAEVVRKLDGVRDVRNLLQVVPKSRKEVVKATDKQIRERIEHTLKADNRFEDIHLKSVDNGVVLLTGKAKLPDALRAVETVALVPGVRHVSSEIEVAERG
jgi:hyperosmotically inducible periplasmic protein